LATTITGRELAEATDAALATLASDARLDAVEVTVPLTETRTGSYLVRRNGTVRRVA